MDATGWSLVGRDATMSELRGAVEAAAAGVGGCILVEGPAGIGKSRVLEAAKVYAASQGMSVAACRARELDSVAPLTTLLGSFQSTEPSMIAADDLQALDHAPLHLVDRIRELIEDCVRERTLLVMPDDAHWSDELIALTLRILVPALSSAPVLWLLARRLSPARGLAQDAIDRLVDEDARRLVLGPLPDDAVAQLCAEVLGAPPDSAVLSLAACGDGNPFLVVELLTTFRDAGRVSAAGEAATLAGNELPPTFLAAVRRRLRDLSDDARRLLDAGSVLGRPFTLHEAAGLVGRAAIDLVPAADEAVDAGNLVERGSEFAFRPDLIREAPYDRLSAPVRLALHREAAAVVQEEGRSAVETAEHLLRGGRISGEQALAVLHEAVAGLCWPGHGGESARRECAARRSGCRCGDRSPARALGSSLSRWPRHRRCRVHTPGIGGARGPRTGTEEHRVEQLDSVRTADGESRCASWVKRRSSAS